MASFSSSYSLALYLQIFMPANKLNAAPSCPLPPLYLILLEIGHPLIAVVGRASLVIKMVGSLVCSCLPKGSKEISLPFHLQISHISPT
ncbi:hypothetical protein ACE6H2_014410 [Prunus campanulata]